MSEATRRNGTTSMDGEDDLEALLAEVADVMRCDAALESGPKFREAHERAVGIFREKKRPPKTSRCR